jgi:hypothetical protein
MQWGMNAGHATKGLRTHFPTPEMLGYPSIVRIVAPDEARAADLPVHSRANKQELIIHQQYDWHMK